MILADQCVFEATIRSVLSAGHEITPLRAVGRVDLSDPEVLALAVARNWILLTNDLDFGDIVRYPPRDHCGVIVLRIRPQTELEVHAVLIKALTVLTREELHKHLVVVDRSKYRVRSSV